MNLYNAIMQAANFIDQNPEQFVFMETDIPGHCGSPGCALGWIHYFSRIKSTQYAHSIDAEALFPQDRGRMDFAFYARMDLVGENFRWRHDAHQCARTLRLYAEKYHGHEKPAARPDSALVADLIAKVVGPVVSLEAKSEELTW